MTPSVCVVVHDVAPATRAACERVFAAVREVAPLPLTLLAVPRWHCDPPSPEFGPWLLAHYEAGHEIALHGYTHQDDGRPRGVARPSAYSTRLSASSPGATGSAASACRRRASSPPPG